MTLHNNHYPGTNGEIRDDMFKCMKCDAIMSRNTFVCDSCERGNRGTTKEIHDTGVVTKQHCRVVSMSEGSSDNEGSQYWDYVDKHSSSNEDSISETDRANPDNVSARRLEELERSAHPPINETRQKAIELLNKGAKELTKRELQAVRDFSKGIPQKATAKRVGISRVAVAQALKRGLTKLKKFTEGKLP